MRGLLTGIVAVALFEAGAAGAAPLPIVVVASRYQFTPGGPEGPPIHLSAGTTYEITFRAMDVEHGVSAIPVLGIPELDLFPGRDESVIVAPTLAQVGRYNFACIRVCGAGHGGMFGAIEVGVDDSNALHLAGGRFRVAATFRAADVPLTLAHPVSLTSDSGAFWFFDPDNVELVVKVLDGCALNGRRWFFATGLTDVEVTLLLEDTLRGGSAIYANPPGTPFPSIQDTSALDDCP